MKWRTHHGSLAVICGRFLDRQGRQVEGDIDAQVISVTPSDLKKVKAGILVACGVEKVEAMRAALVGRYAKYLVTDEATGRLLLSRPTD